MRGPCSQLFSTTLRGMKKGGTFFAAPQKDVDAVKFWAAGQLNHFSALHQSYDDVDVLLRLPSDDDLVLAVMEIVGQSDEALEFVGELVKKRGQLLDGKLSHSQEGGVVAYQKTLQGQEAKPKKGKQPKGEGGAKKQEPQKPAGKSVTKVAREDCYCMGTEHPVLGNCLACGKIICELEGRNLPCLFCGEMFVGVPSGAGGAAGALQDAVARKNALLEYERKSVARSLIYDDQADYFSSESQWLSQAEKTKLREKEREAREQKQKQKRGVKIALDIFGRRMVVCEDETAQQSIYQPFDLEDVLPKEENGGGKKKKKDKTAVQPVLKPSYQPAPSDKTSVKSKVKSAAALPLSEGRGDSKRVQHAYFEVEEETEATLSPSAGQHFAMSGIVFESGAALPEFERSNATIVMDLPNVSGRSNVVARARYPLASLELLLKSMKTEGVRAVVIDFSALDVPDARFNTLAKFHAHLVGEVVSQRADKDAEVWVLPLYSRLRADGDYSACRKYWNELNEIVRKSVTFVVTSSAADNPIVTQEYIRVLRVLFGEKRQLILFDAVDTPFCAYGGRHVGLDLRGLFVVLRDGLHTKAMSVGMLSALEFQKNPALYDPVESVKHIIAAALGQVASDCREAKHLLNLQPFLLSARHTKAEVEVMRKQLSSRRRLEELEESISALRHSEALRQWLGTDFAVLEEAVLRPVEELCQASKNRLKSPKK